MKVTPVLTLQGVGEYLEVYLVMGTRYSPHTLRATPVIDCYPTFEEATLRLKELEQKSGEYLDMAVHIRFMPIRNVKEID